MVTWADLLMLSILFRLQYSVLEAEWGRVISLVMAFACAVAALIKVFFP